MTTVAELIAMLQKSPLELPVHLEGCDCINAATQIMWDSEYVLIGADVGSSLVVIEPEDSINEDNVRAG